MLYRVFSRLLERKIREMEEYSGPERKDIEPTDIEDDYIEILRNRNGRSQQRSASSVNLHKVIVTL